VRNLNPNEHHAGKEFIVEEQTGLLAFLRARLSGQSRNNVKSILSGGAVSVDGKTVTQHDHALRPGQCVRIAPAEQQRYKMPKRLKIIYEDDELLTVNKPAGLLTVATGGASEPTAYRDATEYVRGQSEQPYFYRP
jgi:23S rRNA pseudouridine1911/1915/1917 synthase